MALTANQGLELPDGTDNANVPLAMTNYNTGIEGRLVQRYLSSADRTARNPAPVEGEISYLANTDTYEKFITFWSPLINVPVSMYDSTGIFITSTVYVTTGGPIVGRSITVPPSGTIRVGWANVANHSSGSGGTYVAAQVNSGTVVGSGAVITAASDQRSSQGTGTATVATGYFAYFTGLTPNTSVNAFLLHRASVAGGSVGNRVIEVQAV